MDISFDPAKRAATLKNRGLDFADAGEVFAGKTITIKDERRPYGEERYITAATCTDVVWSSSGRRAAMSVALFR